MVSTVAIAYVMHKAPYIFPIIGGRKVEHFNANLEALDISLTPDQMKFLDEIVKFTKGFPYDFVVSVCTCIDAARRLKTCATSGRWK